MVLSLMSVMDIRQYFLISKNMRKRISLLYQKVFLKSESKFVKFRIQKSSRHSNIF